MGVFPYSNQSRTGAFLLELIILIMLMTGETLLECTSEVCLGVRSETTLVKWALISTVSSDFMLLFFFYLRRNMADPGRSDSKEAITYVISVISVYFQTISTPGKLTTVEWFKRSRTLVSHFHDFIACMSRMRTENDISSAQQSHSGSTGCALHCKKPERVLPSRRRFRSL